jgi:hypothetical protein
MASKKAIPVSADEDKTGKIFTLTLIQQRLYKKEHKDREAAVEHALNLLYENCTEMQNFDGFTDRCGRHIYIIDRDRATAETLLILDQAMEEDSHVH